MTTCDGCGEEIAHDQQLVVRLRDMTSVISDVACHSYACVVVWASRKHEAHRAAVAVDLVARVEQTAANLADPLESEHADRHGESHEQAVAAADWFAGAAEYQDATLAPHFDAIADALGGGSDVG
jgi:hypothetical protein